MEKRPTDEQLAKYRKNAQDQSLSAEVRAKFKAVVDKFDNVAEKIGEDVVKVAEPKKTRGRKPASAKTTKTKQTSTDIEKAKAEIKAKTGKTEAECESIIEQYRALRTKAQEGKRKAEKASADNKERVGKLERKGDIIEGTNEKTADAVIESTAKDVVEKIEKEVEAVEAKAETEAKAEVAKDKTITTPKAKKEAVEAKVEKKVAEKTKTIVKRVVIDTSTLLTSIAESLGKFDKDSQKEFLIKLRSDIDKLLSKYAFGGMTDGAVQVMNVQQSNMSSSSVNPSHFAKGGGVVSVYDLRKGDKIKTRKGDIETIERKISSGYYTKENEYSQPFESIEFVERPNRKMANGGVVGQEIVFDDGGEENRGVIKDIHENTGDYIVNTDDGRTILVQLDRDVISLGGMRKKAPMMDAPRKRFGLFAGGGSIKGRNSSTGEKFGLVIGSNKYSDEYVPNGTEINVRKTYNSRMSEVKLIFDADNNLYEIIDYGYSLDGYPNTSQGVGKVYNADEKGTKKILSEMYNASFANSIIDLISDKYAGGGGIEDVIVYDNGGESFDRYTIFTPDGSVYGMSENASGFNMYIGDSTEIEKGSHLGKRLKSVPKSIQKAVMNRMSETYAKGGLTEHGLRVGDRIEADGKTFGYKDEIQIIDSDKKRRFVNLDKGNRGQGFAKGGNISSMLRNRRGK
jgi:hypothetical protein